MMIKVYIVEDNPFLLEDMIYSLNAQGFDCSGAKDSESFEQLISKQLPDIAILDWNLPTEDGLSIAHRLHNNTKTKHIGIIFLTVRDSLDDRVAGLEFADSFLIKPIDFLELGAIINSTVRRLPKYNKSLTSKTTWQLYKKTLELYTPQNKALTLSYREFVALEKLAENYSTPISAQEIVESWGNDWLTFEKNRLELVLSRLRSKIKSNSSINFNPIRSVRNEGYHLMIPVEIIETKQNEYTALLEGAIKNNASLSLSDHLCELSPLAVMVTCKNTNIIKTNPAFSEITGYSFESVSGKNPHLLSSGRHNEAFYQEMWHCINTKGSWSGEIYNRRKNGQLYLQKAYISVRYSAKGEVENYISIFSDITQEREYALHLKHLCEHDLLTNLPNRHLLHQKFEEALASAKRLNTKLSILFIDLNKFKPINDQFGHANGDQLLQEVASRIQSCIRETDTVARIGGDEFIVLMTNLEDDNASKILSNKLKEVIAQKLIISDNVCLKISASIGTANFPEHGDDFETLSYIADMSMFEDKKNRNL